MAAETVRHTRLYWLLPVACAALLVIVDLLLGRLLLPGVVAKGRRAPYTLRAITDTAFDLRPSFAEEARAAQRSYLPIYDKDNQVLYDTREAVVVAARAEASELGNRATVYDGGLDDAGDDAGADGAADGGEGPALQRDSGQAGPTDAAVVDGPDGALASVDPAEGLAGERQAELEALIRGFFELLEPFYKDGVIADHEFPAKRKKIRVFSPTAGEDGARPLPRYVIREVSSLHRFSELRSGLETGGERFFFKTEPVVRGRVIDFILERLPPNLSYAKENKEVIDISEVTGVKVVLIRRGQILARRGQPIDTRAYYAIRASVVAANRTTKTQQAMGQFGLLVATLLLFVVAVRRVAPMPRLGVRSQLIVYLGLVVIALFGGLVLATWPVQSILLPQAALALVGAVLFGRIAAVAIAVVTAVTLSVVHVLDPSALISGLAGGVCGALIVRHRGQGRLLAAGVIVGLIQALGLEAARTLYVRPQTFGELLAAAQAFGGGVLSGVVARAVLPFAQRLVGQASRGKLQTLADFDNPLTARLRERHPEAFARTVRVVTLADRAVNAVGADRLLTRCGALLRDIGKAEVERPDPAAPAAERANAEISHLAEGLRIAREAGVPGELCALIAEHHGTMELSELLEAARARDPAVDPGTFRYPGPKPTTLESAVLLIATEVERAARKRPGVERAQVVRDVLSRLMLDVQFDDCNLTQGQLCRIRDALIAGEGM